MLLENSYFIDSITDYWFPRSGNIFVSLAKGGCHEVTGGFAPQANPCPLRRHCVRRSAAPPFSKLGRRHLLEWSYKGPDTKV